MLRSAPARYCTVHPLEGRAPLELWKAPSLNFGSWRFLLLLEVQWQAGVILVIRVREAEEQVEEHSRYAMSWGQLEAFRENSSKGVSGLLEGQSVRFFNNCEEVNPPPLSPIGRLGLQIVETAHIAGGKRSVATVEGPAKEPLHPQRPPHSELSARFGSVTLRNMAALNASSVEGVNRPDSPAQDDALDAAVAQSNGIVQKQVSKIESKVQQSESSQGFLEKLFSRKASPARMRAANEPPPKVLGRTPSPAGARPAGLPPKRALSPQPFRKMREAMRRSQSAVPQRNPAAVREPSLEVAAAGRMRVATPPSSGADTASHQTKEWVQSLMPPRPQKDGDAKTPKGGRPQPLASVQSGPSRQEPGAQVLSPPVSNSEDDDVWDFAADADRPSSNSSEGSENDHLRIDHKEFRRQSAPSGMPTNRNIDLQKEEFDRLLQRQEKMDAHKPPPSGVDLRRSLDFAAQPIDERARAPSAELQRRLTLAAPESGFAKEGHSFSMVAQRRRRKSIDGADFSGPRSESSNTFGKAQTGLSYEAQTSRQTAPGTQSFGFAFNNAQFSDRILVLELAQDANLGPEDMGRMSSRHSPTVRKSIHINSAIVAVKSNYFYNLLGDTEQQSPIMRIRPEDEAPVMDMLRFMYSPTLTASEPEELAQVLIVSDRYGVVACFKHVFRLLSALPMDAKLACLFLDLPRHLKDPNQVQNLVLLARSFLVVHFRDLERTYRSDDFLGLSLMGIRTILESDVLQISSEVTALNALVNWSQHHFPTDEGQRAVVVAKLAHLVRFPLMTTETLRQALEMPELNSDVGRGLIVEALFFRAEPFFKQSKLAETETAHSRYLPRSNDSRLSVYVAPMDEANRQASVFAELKKTQMQNLQWGACLLSRPFMLGNQTLAISVVKKMGRHSEAIISVVVQQGTFSKAKVPGEYELFSRFHTAEPFQSLSRGKLSFKSGREEQGQTTMKVDGQSTMIYLRADLVIRS